MLNKYRQLLAHIPAKLTLFIAVKGRNLSADKNMPAGVLAYLALFYYFAG